MSDYCHDERHDTPCPLPCAACEDECDQAERRDDEVGEQLQDIDDLMLAGYTYQEARVRLGYDLNRGERTV